jgi:hypothetical protein
VRRHRLRLNRHPPEAEKARRAIDEVLADRRRATGGELECAARFTADAAKIQAMRQQ